MLFGKSVLALLPFAAGLAAASAVEERDVCVSINGPVIQVYITTNTVNVPVLINTYVPANGIVTAAGTTINIINAPTQLITVVNSVQTQTVSSTATVTVGPNGVSTQVGPSVNIINYPVYISTFVQQNTIINNNGATVIVNNAPTTLITTATGTITSTVTTTSTVTSNVAQSTFIVGVNGANNMRKARRQNQVSGYLASDGSIVNSCSSAVPLTLNNGQLFVAGTTNSYSARSNDTVITFAASFVQKAISTFFAASSSSAVGLSWTNTNFTNGAAAFFIQNNFLKAQLQGTAPAGGASLTTILAAQCSNGNIVSTTTTASTSMSTSANSTSSAMTSTTSGSASTTGSSSTLSLSTTLPVSTTITTLATTIVTTTSDSTLITTPVLTTVTTVVPVTTTTTTTVTTIANPPPNPTK